MLTAGSLDTDSGWRPLRLTSAWGWRQHRLTSTWVYLARSAPPYTPKRGFPTKKTEGRRVVITFGHPSSEAGNRYGALLLGFFFLFWTFTTLSPSLIDFSLWQEHFKRDRGASFLWPAEERKVEVLSSSATRGSVTGTIKTPPWAQVRPWRSPPFIYFVSFSVFPLGQSGQTGVKGASKSQPASIQRQQGSGNVWETPE
ncbi:hypothetical protein Taro_041766 [Colocasia esculenta]|uniref:Uncharacterized protein n=1 Tax=Colocasia esculenta TaxID=4460 RepID=A0A843WMM2_COLES|nr:hypothetical protein [Colocasia esculenta]